MGRAEGPLDHSARRLHADRRGESSRPREGDGLECDKFSQAALDAHWAGFMQKILDDLGPLAGQDARQFAD